MVLCSICFTAFSFEMFRFSYFYDCIDFEWLLALAMYRRIANELEKILSFVRMNLCLCAALFLNISKSMLEKICKRETCQCYFIGCYRTNCFIPSIPLPKNEMEYEQWIWTVIRWANCVRVCDEHVLHILLN